MKRWHVKANNEEVACGITGAYLTNTPTIRLVSDGKVFMVHFYGHDGYLEAKGGTEQPATISTRDKRKQLDGWAVFKEVIES